MGEVVLPSANSQSNPAIGEFLPSVNSDSQSNAKLRKSQSSLNLSPRLTHEGSLIEARCNILEDEPEKHKKHVTFWGAFFVNMICSIGASLLFYPYLFSTLGYVLSFCFLMLAGFLETTMLLLFYKCLMMAKELHPEKQITSLEDVGRLAFGNWFYVMAFIVWNLTIFIVAVTFFILVGNAMTGFHDFLPGTEVSGVKVSNFVWSGIVAIPMILLTYLPDLRVLSYAAKLGVVAVVAVLVNQIFLSAKAMHDDFNNDPSLGGLGPAKAVADLGDGIDAVKVLLGGLKTFLYGYGAIVSAPSVVLDMGPNHPSFPKAAIWSHVCITLIYLIFGYLGYAAFGTAAPEEFIDSDSVIHEHYYAYWCVAAASSVLNNLVTIPIFLLTVSRAFERFLKSEKYVYKICLRTVIAVLCVALACTPISYFTQLSGLIPMCTLSLVALIWPVCFYWKLKSMHEKKQGLSRPYKALIKDEPIKAGYHVIVVVIAVIAIIFGFWTSLEDLINKVKDGNK